MSNTASGLSLNRQFLERGRQKMSGNGHAQLRPALDRLLNEANGALAFAPVSVMDKTLAPTSGDKHDYLSFGTYWWPNPDTPDGLPYVRRDGIVNPSSKMGGSDTAALQSMSEAVETLVLAWYFTSDERFAVHAAKLLRTWFISPATRMNPHLEFGQAIPGICDGRCIGIIDTWVLVRVVNALVLLTDRQVWADQDRLAMHDWCRAYLDWLLHSKLGKEEASQHNNHGTWFDAQAVALALYVEDQQAARAIMAEVGPRRIDPHIATDGRQQHELARTRSFDYSVFNLRAVFLLAEMAAPLGIDLWNYRGKSGGGIKEALEFLAPYADLAAEWPYEQIIPATSRSETLPLLLARAVHAWPAEANKFCAAFEKLPPDIGRSHRAQLLYPL